MRSWTLKFHSRTTLRSEQNNPNKIENENYLQGHLPTLLPPWKSSDCFRVEDVNEIVYFVMTVMILMTLVMIFLINTLFLMLFFFLVFACILRVAHWVRNKIGFSGQNNFFHFKIQNRQRVTATSFYIRSYQCTVYLLIHSSLDRINFLTFLELFSLPPFIFHETHV